MKKKPASLELVLAGEQPARESQGTPEVRLEARPKPIKRYEKATVYLPRAAAKRLKQMALDHDRRVNDFLQEGVDLMLAKYGERSLSEFETK